jgi:cytochrome P450
MADWPRQHGDVVFMQLLRDRFFLVTEPDVIGQVLMNRDGVFIKDRLTRDLTRVIGHGLITSEGAFWKRQRKLVHSAFTPKRVKSYAGIMTEQAERAVEGWSHDAEMDIHEEMSRLTLRIVAKSLFDAEVSEQAKDVGEALTVVSEWYADYLQLGMGLLSSLPIPRNVRLWRAVRDIDRVLYGIIEQRRTSSEGPDDLLTRLLRAHHEDGSQMTDTQLRDECMTLFLAGHETTALALTYAWYLLSKYPDIERRLHAELKQVLGGRPPTMADVPRLVLTERILKETMRLYPPVYVIGREATRDTELAGYPMPAGTQVAMPQWAVHRDARWFANPEGFDPDRWAAEGSDRPQYAYFPFGGGPRICIGNHFAMLEGVLLLATIAQRTRLELRPGMRLELQPAVTLRPRDGVPMRVHRREPGAARVQPNAAE